MSPEGAAKTAATLAALQDIEDEENYEDERRPGAPMPIDHVQSERVNIHVYEGLNEVPLKTLISKIWDKISLICKI